MGYKSHNTNVLARLSHTPAASGVSDTRSGLLVVEVYATSIGAALPVAFLSFFHGAYLQHCKCANAFILPRILPFFRLY